MKRMFYRGRKESSGLLGWCLMLASFVGTLFPISNLLAQSFTAAAPGFSWRFPADHGEHPSYQTEWWYYTGQLYGEGATPFKDKPQFGFQLTFFRKGEFLSGVLQQDYMAHAAITDIAKGETIFESRLGGGALGLSGVAHSSLRAWSGDWSVDVIGGSLVLRLAVSDSARKRALTLRILVGESPSPWQHGINGLSVKAPCQGCASMYYSLPRLPLKATYSENRNERTLHGLGWMDHEFMTNSLSPDQQGWDWMGLMLKDGRSVMLFRVRGGSGEDSLAGSIKSEAGSRALTRGDFTITPEATWKSSATGANYPIEWRIKIPSEGIDTVIRARVPNSEIGRSSAKNAENKSGAVTYWEGPVASLDEGVIGYLEMTGYAGKIVM